VAAQRQAIVRDHACDGVLCRFRGSVVLPRRVNPAQGLLLWMNAELPTARVVRMARVAPTLTGEERAAELAVRLSLLDVASRSNGKNNDRALTTLRIGFLTVAQLPLQIDLTRGRSVGIHSR